MSYNPIIHKIAEGQDVFETINTFINDWYEFELPQQMSFCDFNRLFEIGISDEINRLLNFLIQLNCTIVSGKKRIAYSAFEYLFCQQRLKLGYDKQKQFLFLLQEGGQDFYYGIHQCDFHEKNPKIVRMVVANKTKEISYFEDSNLIEFLISRICVRASKMGVKAYSIFIDDENMTNKMSMFVNLFDYKTNFGKVTIFEKSNVVAAIEKNVDMSDILTVNKWEQGQKEFTKAIVDIFEWNGWSDNSERFKL